MPTQDELNAKFSAMAEHEQHEREQGLPGWVVGQAIPNPTAPNPAPNVFTNRQQLIDLGEAMERELNQLRNQVWEMDRRLGKFEQEREEQFQKEAQARLNPVKGYGTDALEVSPLHRVVSKLKGSI